MASPAFALAAKASETVWKPPPAPTAANSSILRAAPDIGASLYAAHTPVTCIYGRGTRKRRSRIAYRSRHSGQPELSSRRKSFCLSKQFSPQRNSSFRINICHRRQKFPADFATPCNDGIVSFHITAPAIRWPLQGALGWNTRGNAIDTDRRRGVPHILMARKEPQLRLSKAGPEQPSTAFADRYQKQNRSRQRYERYGRRGRSCMQER